ncbi:MAG TPA: PilT/PilU family type 4a pilus ATPase [Candidatus Sulfotelmatobacter sp.]|jgi:twitching motility protein PilT|nr:PilT/PilU family type 4a pilus ATPase [Candidatus Sulfotelmatobacter sp.]
MRRPELDQILTTMLASQPEVSDINFTVGRPPQVEAYGELKPVILDPPIAQLSPFQIETIAMNIIGDNPWQLEDLLRHGSCDASYALGDTARFRVNVFSQRGNYSIVMRQLNSTIPTIDQLGLPEVLKEIPREKTGLVLVTGATGSGKSTTLAAILDEINKVKPVHVVTLEDPVEYLHKHSKATFNQRELGVDFDSYANGLRAALRQAPKVILVGEMRDRDTVKIALSAAETGHLVLSTLHTINAGETVNRILGMFEPEEQEQVRIRLSDSLRWVVSQRLAPKEGGARYALIEIMGANLRTQEAIRLGESEGKTFYEIIEASNTFGWRTFDHACLEAFEQGLISEDTAMLYCTKRSVVSRGIDNLKKERGEMASTAGSLRMKAGAGPNGETGTAPPTLKLR